MKKGLVSLLLACAVVFTGFGTAFAAAGDNTVSNKNFVTSSARVVVDGKAITLERSAVTVDNKLLVPAATTLRALGASVYCYENTGIIRIKKGTTSVLMKVGEKDAYINSAEKILDTPPVFADGTLMVPLISTAGALKVPVKWDGASNTAYLGKLPAGSTPSRGGDVREEYVVVVDAGHGGSETGAIAGGVYEKNLNLDIAKRLYTLLKGAGISVYMTRTGDSTVGLYERSGLANKLNADLFISVHNNAQSQKSVSGSMSLYYPNGVATKSGFTSKEFAAIVQKEMLASLGTKDLGLIPRPNLAVLRTTNMPAVLAEVGYMTNSSELKRLETGDFRQKAAEALKDAVLKALDRL